MEGREGGEQLLRDGMQKSVSVRPFVGSLTGYGLEVYQSSPSETFVAS